VHGDGEGPVHRPSYTALGDGGVVSWFTFNVQKEGTEVRARWLDESGNVTQSAVIDSSVGAFGSNYRPLMLLDSTLVWVTDHDGPQETELRLVAMRDGNAVGGLAIPNPYVAFVDAVRYGQ